MTIKIRVTRGVQQGLPFASGVLAITGLVTSACATPPQEESVGSDESALEVSNPGSGVFELGWAYGTPTGYSFNLTKSTTDEYVRALEKLSFSMPAYFFWYQLHPGEPIPQDLERLKKISAKVTITYYKDGASYGQTSVSTTSYEGDQLYSLRAVTNTFVVSRRAQSMKFSIELTDDGVSGPPLTKTLEQGSFFEQAVIGGTLPKKTLLFDNYYRDLRTRVLEGGNVLANSNVQIGYTDWRAATFVDASSIDRQIGTATSYGRFGAIEIPIYGDIEYEIAAGTAIDGNWQGEQALAANSKSALMPPNGNRVCYEANISVPQGAQSLQVYFHVRAFLKVDYSKFQNIRWRKYNDGERLLVREKWDNENGAQNDNYDFVIGAR